MTSSIIDELQWRGLIAQSTDIDQLSQQVEKESISLYCGFDPTASSLHAGHLIPLLTMKRFQAYGHRPILLAGGATGLIGDPREVGERAMQSQDTVNQWAGNIREQLSRFVDFDGVQNPAVLVNNLDWTENLSAIDFLRNLGKHFSLNTMLGRETVKRRLESDGISYTEFSYMLLQANDYLHLHQELGCSLQIGGADQWGNIISGVDLNRRVTGDTVHAITVPLVTSSDGKKFGKSTGGGSIWLDAELTSSYSWYQYFVNTHDADVEKYLKWFTFLDQQEIADIVAQSAEKPHLRIGQTRLAEEMTNLIHGEAATEGAQLAAKALFGRGDLGELDKATLVAALKQAHAVQVSRDQPHSIVELLVDSGLCESKGAARRAVKEGGAYVNNEKVTDETWTPSEFLHDNWLVVRRGKKNMAGVELI